MVMTSIAHFSVNHRLTYGIRWFASLALSALLMCIHLTVGAQPSWSLDWGKPYKADQPGDILGFIHVDPTYSYAIRAKLPKLRGSSKEQKVALERYDIKLNFVKSSPIAMNYKGEPLEYKGFVFVSNNPFVLCGYHNAKQDKNYLFARSVNMLTMKEEGEYLKILEIDLDNKFRGVEYKMTPSPDSSLLLISGTISFLKESNKHYWLSVIDKNGKVVWSKNVKSPYSSFRIAKVDYSLDNDGNVFALMERVRSNKEKKADGDKNFDVSYHVFAHLDNGRTEKEYNCSLEGSNYMTDVKLVTTSAGTMQCAGYYYEKKSNVSEFWTSV